MQELLRSHRQQLADEDFVRRANIDYSALRLKLKNELDAIALRTGNKIELLTEP